MSITAYTGLPGSGKSHGVVEYVILPALRAGREVWTNIPMRDELVQRDFGSVPVQFKMSDVLDNDDWFQEVLPKGVLLVMDEVWRLWPAGLKANNVNEGHKSFLAEHRHLVSADGRSTEIVLCTQDLSQIASFARALVENTYRSVKLTAIGSKSRYRIDIYEGPVTGAAPPVSKRLRQMFGKYKPEVYQYYISHTMSETGAAGDETKADNRQNVLKSTGVMIVVALVAFVFVLFGVQRVWHMMFGSPEPESVPVGAEPVMVHAVSREVQLKKPPKPKSYDPFADMSYHISFNNKSHTTIDYKVTFTSGQSSFTLDLREMKNLGYEFMPVNQCLLLVTVNSRRYPVTCDTGRSQGLVNFDWGVGNEEEGA